LGGRSPALAFPTTAGDSYTATLAVVDEAGLCPDLDRLMRAVKPATDAGGRMILLSRPDKGRPLSAFKKVYTAARQGLKGWAAVFLPWHARPQRDPAWYDAQRRDIVARTGALDDLHEQYPASEAEALAPRSLDKRIAPGWLQQCYVPRDRSSPSRTGNTNPPPSPAWSCTSSRCPRAAALRGARQRWLPGRQRKALNDRRESP
jgi:hypothetical protein